MAALGGHVDKINGTIKYANSLSIFKSVLVIGH